MATKVASLLIDVAADIASLRKDFDQAGKTVQGFGSTVAAIGKGIAAAFSIHEVIAFGERIQADIDAMADLAENLKIPVEEFQALQAAALLAGQSVEATGNAMAKFNVFIGKASEGNKEAIETLQSLGVTINNLDGSSKSTSQRLQETAKAIIAIEDPAKRAAAEVAVFGKSGQQVSAILTQWARPLADVNRELQDMGLVHSPEVIKQMAEMADRADIGAKKIDVLFAPFYAMAKSKVIDAVAGSLQTISNVINGINTGNIDTLVKAVTGLALIGTIAGAPAGAMILSTIGNPVQQLDQQITAAERDLARLESDLEAFKRGGKDFEQQTMQTAGEAAQAQLRLSDLRTKLAAMTMKPTTVTSTKDTGSNPAVKGSGVDKFAEAMRRVTEETNGTNKAIAEFQQRVAAGTSTKDAERLSKLQQDIANKTSQMIKDLTPAQADIITPRIKALEELKFTYEELKRTQQEADTVNRQYGDGEKERRNSIEDLTELRQKQLIGEREFAAAQDDINRKAAEQKLINEGLGEGITQMAAGWQYAALKTSESMSSFQVGQQLFTNSVSLMSDSVSEFVQTGVLDFEKLASGFAKMLADMATQLIIHQALKAILGIGSAATGPTADSLMGLTPVSSGGGGWLASLFGGGRAAGGPVTAGVGYRVGENGPERFVPSVPGRIDSMDGSDTGSVTVNLDMRKAEGARDTSAAMEFGRRVKAAVVDVIQNEKRPGGTLSAVG